MGTRAWWIATALCVSGTAYAQAPGVGWDEGTGAPGTVEPQAVYVPPVACHCIANVMENRWAIGLSAGSFVASPDEGYMAETHFDFTELAFRFRATPHLELEATIGGGHEHDGDQAMSHGALNLRYRFAIHSHWNWWVMAGVGMAAIARDDSDQRTIDANTRPLVQAGFGVEHRWQQFAIQAELKTVGLGPAQGDNSFQNHQDQNDTWTAGSFTLGAGYYF